MPVHGVMCNIQHATDNIWRNVQYAACNGVHDAQGQRKFISSLGQLYHRAGEYGRAAKCYEAALQLTHVGTRQPGLPTHDY
jgi:hypothetical protein